jgi:hypothetical protein
MEKNQDVNVEFGCAPYILAILILMSLWGIRDTLRRSLENSIKQQEKIVEIQTQLYKMEMKK